MVDVEAMVAELGALLGERCARGDDLDRVADLLGDESLHAAPGRPACVLWPERTEEVAEVVRCVARHGASIVPRGSGTGLSGAAVATEDAVVVSFARMDAVLEVDSANRVAVVQPGVTLAQLDEALAGSGLFYPVFPGESSASLGGNVNTNAGGMRAVRHGVTRNHILGLELVLASGEVLRSGGRYSKVSSGYDLTQLVIGSEGTLALVTEVTLRLSHRLPLASTTLIPFPSLEAICEAIPAVDVGAVGPSILEYLDFITMESIATAAGVELAIDPEVKAQAMAYLIVVLEAEDDLDLERRTTALAEAVEPLGGLDLYVLEPRAGTALVEARERAFYVAKASGADDIIDAVVPRSEIPALLTRASELAAEAGALVAGCGHAGDGNVHLSVFCPDDEARHGLLAGLFATTIELGGAVSGEHGLGVDKRAYHDALADPLRIELEDRIKHAFDPGGVLRPIRPREE